MTPEKAKAFLTADLKGEGFDDVRIARADSIPQVPERLHAFLEAGRHGTMGWMKETAERRGDPLTLWPETRSVVMAAMNYGPDPGHDPLAALDRHDRATISIYAQNRDYHDVVKGKLKQAAGRFAAKTGAQVKVFVDTAPVMEKPLGQAAGLGWQGKHTNLVSRDLGSWFFLGSIFHHAGAAAETSAEDRPLRLLPGCLDSLPDRRLSRALSARRAALHLLPHDRASGPGPARIPQGDGQPDLRLRRLSRRLPVEQVRLFRARGQADRARGS
jgi:epoxyqueuosine reductase